jgi:hypothetical protein
MKAEKEEIAEEPFVIRPYLKSELAHLYNPYVPKADTTTAKTPVIAIAMI